MSGAYYNEFNPYAAAWLRNLIAAGEIAPGDVDERSIVDVQPDDLRGYTQCHFFAGIGGWSLAARLAGWPDDRPLWTGSCPCQPFSVAGKGEGEEDERHLWPEQFRLIEARRPPAWMGEQVSAAVGKYWLDGVLSDLESINYSGRAAIVPACAVDAPHRRDRIWIVADTSGDGREQGQQAPAASRHREISPSARGGALANPDSDNGHWRSGPLQVGWNAIEGETSRGGRKYRAQWRTKPGLGLLANGVPGRVGRLCAYGNAIVPQVAAEVIAAYIDASPALPGQCAAPEVALPPRCDIEVSALREGFRRAPQ